MQDPFSLIRGYFKPTPVLPLISGLAAPDKLAPLLPVLINAAAVLKLVPLSDADRVALRGKDQGNQRQVTRGLLRLLDRRPALALASGLDGATLLLVADKDEACDLLVNTLDLLIQLVDDGLLLVRAAQSSAALSLHGAARALLLAASGDPQKSMQLRVQFGALDQNARALQQKEERSKQSAARKERLAQAQATDARARLAAAPEVDRLLDDARRLSDKKGGAR